MSILGLTLDYGPFQFLDAFNPDHLCNHSDSSGRYAFKRQPGVAHWNLFCLGQALMPLIESEEAALQALQATRPSPSPPSPAGYYCNSEPPHVCTSGASLLQAKQKQVVLARMRLPDCINIAQLPRVQSPPF